MYRYEGRTDTTITSVHCAGIVRHYREILLGPSGYNENEGFQVERVVQCVEVKICAECCRVQIKHSHKLHSIAGNMA